MTHKDLTLGIIGLGARTEGVYKNVLKATEGHARIACFYDTDKVAAQSRARKLPGGTEARSVGSYKEVVDDSSVDAIMIGTPNAFHVEPAIYTMELGKPLYLEKPVASTLEDHNRLLQTQLQTGAPVILGFVLRFAPFYRKIKEIVESGSLGKIMFLQAVEHMGISLTADCFLRGWRAYREFAGPLLLEKCCHDIDIINWLLQVPCEVVVAVNDRTVFVPREDRPEYCRLCDDAECQYRASGSYADRAIDNTGQRIYFSNANDYCVYNRKQDIADHTTLLARYEGGVHVSFNVTMGVARGARRIRIVGSKAQLSGCAEDNSIVLEPLQRAGKPETIVPEGKETGGHYGGDKVLAQEFVRLARHPELTCETNIVAGYESGIICLAADESARTQVVVEVGKYRKERDRLVRKLNSDG